MTQPEQHQGPEDMRKVFRAMQKRMMNYALHHFAHVNARTLISLQEVSLLDDQDGVIGSTADLDVLQDPNHLRRVTLSPGPLLLYSAPDGTPKRLLIEVPVNLCSALPAVRKVSLAELERLISEGSLRVTLKTKDILAKTRSAIMSDTPHEWRPAAVALNDAFSEDALVALQGARQSLECEPVAQDTLNMYVPRVLYPTVSSLDSISLQVKNPETEHAKLIEIIAVAVREARSLSEACELYNAKLGHLPLAPAYAMAEVVSRWITEHSNADAWTEVWAWARSAFGPIPRYHACSVFVLHPEFVPDGKLSDLWQEILHVVHNPGTKDAANIEHEPWTLRRDLTRHINYHLESQLPGTDGASITSFAWWFAEQVASLFPDEPKSAEFYRKNWVGPALNRSSNIWLAASPRVGRSFLRYVTASVHSPWASSLLALMGMTMDRLTPAEQSVENKKLFHDALVSNLITSLPFPSETPADPTYALECSMSETALKWSLLQSEDQKRAIEQLCETSRTLGMVEGLIAAMRKIPEASLADQVATAISLKAKAYTDPAIAAGVWELLSDGAWRTLVLGKAEERVLGLLLEAFIVLQVDNQDKWFSQLPQYIAEVCEKAETEERRRLLFLSVVQTSSASDTVSALRRLLRGSQKAKFVVMVKEYRERVESVWPQYPPWVQGRLRALFASLRVV